jgi:hypothetical protein
VFAPWGSDQPEPVDLAGKRAIEMHVDALPASPLTSVEVPHGELDGSIEHPERARRQPGDPAPPAASGETQPLTATSTTAPTTTAGGDGGRNEAVPNSTDAAKFDESAPIVYRKTTVKSNSQEYEDYTLVQETTTVTEINSLDQTRTSTTSTSYAKPKEGDATALSASEPPPTT